jgi:hypothetical protein
VFQRLKRTMRSAFAAPGIAAQLDALLQLELAREFERLQAGLRLEMPENPAARGFKVYSQADEDGIIEAICERLGLATGSFVEIGCGNGLENNTHYLLLKGWRGVWVDGDPTHIAAITTALPASDRLRVLHRMVDRDNATGILDDPARKDLGGVDLLSVDIDGNDLDVALACTTAWRPKILIVEYNAKFPYGCIVQVRYDAAHRWRQDDYHGASLGACVRSLTPDYVLVSCNLAGTNAFFVRRDLATAVADYPPQRLYQPARFHLTAIRSGHAASLSFLRAALEAKGATI